MTGSVRRARRLAVVVRARSATAYCLVSQTTVPFRPLTGTGPRVSPGAMATTHLSAGRVTHPGPPVVLDVDGLRPADVIAVARSGADVRLADGVLDAVAATRAEVDRLAAQERPVYGVSTGFGALATRHIAVGERERLQRALVRSHAAGTGPEVEREVVRAMMLLRLRTLATGRTGV